MSSNSLVLTAINGEPRVHDLALAERLGFDQPRDIRKLIKRNETKLLKFGVCATVAQTSGELGGRPATEFYLNQKQAIFICMKSETERAFDVQIEIVHVFDAYLNGALNAAPAPAAPQPTLSADQQAELANQVRSCTAAWIYSSQTAAWIYNHLRVAFNVSRWQDIPESHYAAALALLNSKRAAAQEFLLFVNESRDWFNREVMGAGTPWTPALQRKLNAERGRRVPMPPVVDWRALDQQQTGQPPLAF